MRPAIAQMIAADAHCGLVGAVVEDRPDAHREPDPLGERFEAPHQHRRPEASSVAHEARGEIDDADLAAVAVGDRGLEYRRVGQIALARFHGVAHHDIHEATRRRMSIDERTKDRIAVETGEAEPIMPPIAVDEARNRTIADNREIKGGHATGGLKFARYV